MNCSISHPTKNINGSIDLPSSKSISNRVLIIQALCKKDFTISNLSTADDTQILQHFLKKKSSKINTEDAGTAIRFLTAFTSLKEKKFLIDGSERMRNRPIKILVDALNQLGAKITYNGKEGFPPLTINGTIKNGGNIIISGNVSSQYISALLMIAPILKKGLTIHLEGTIVSKPYINMTLSVMEYFGIKSHWNKNKICIKPQEYQAKDITIEPDWSAAAFFFELVALTEKGSVLLKNLKPQSWQGDQVLLKLFKKLGVQTNFTKEGLYIHKNICKKNQYTFDLLQCPDITQALCCALSGLKKSATIYGLQTLKIKETDRLKALKKELIKFSVMTKIDQESIQIDSLNFNTPNQSLSSHNDHRMAMSLAPLSLVTKKITVTNANVVTKSYPNFWKELKKLGFIITFSTHSNN